VTSLPFYVVHAFTSKRFAGNPAAVCLDDEFPPDDVMQRIAKENGLSETAFLAPREGDDWDLRWFTPAVEVDLCGHATLAAAYVLFQDVDPDLERVTFHTASGPLTAHWLGEEQGVRIDLPAVPVTPATPSPALLSALGPRIEPEDAQQTRGDRWLLRLADEGAVRALRPDMDALAVAAPAGVIVTAPGTEADIASRFFAPAIGVPEDPVTGSAHAALVPYWCALRNVTSLVCDQVGPRGGRLLGAPQRGRVHLTGTAVLYVRGELLPD
jgi:PhzF family phenazine biosynthesis protein